VSKPTAEPIPNPAPWVPKPKGPGFLKRHPYFKNLLKLSGYIFVGYNTLMLASLGPIVAIFVILFAIGSSMPQSAQNLPTLDPVYGEGFNQLLSIKVSGTILGESDDATSPFDLASDATYGYDVKKKLMDAANNPDINGVIL
jgi:hypothetical protein